MWSAKIYCEERDGLTAWLTGWNKLIGQVARSPFQFLTQSNGNEEKNALIPRGRWRLIYGNCIHEWRQLLLLREHGRRCPFGWRRLRLYRLLREVPFLAYVTRRWWSFSCQMTKFAANRPASSFGFSSCRMPTGWNLESHTRTWWQRTVDADFIAIRYSSFIVSFRQMASN